MMCRANMIQYGTQFHEFHDKQATMASRRQRPKKQSWGVITMILVLVLSGSVLVFTVSRHSSITADYAASPVSGEDGGRLRSSTVLPSGHELAAAATPARYDVVFHGTRLGLTLEESLGGSLWPIVAAIDRATAARSLIEPNRAGGSSNPGPSRLDAASVQLPGVGDQLVAINGRPVLDESRESAAVAAAGPEAVFDAVLEQIEAAGRPLQLSFQRTIITTTRSANDAANDAALAGNDFKTSHVDSSTSRSHSGSGESIKSTGSQQHESYSSRSRYSSGAQTSNDNNKNYSSTISSRVVERDGVGWSDSGVRPGCVYWWCFPHPKAPAPPGPPGTLRPPQTQRWVNEAWLQTLRQRYPDHVRKIHPNRSAYYTEPKKHYDLYDVAFGEGAVHLFAPRDAHTQHLLSKGLRRRFQESEAARHKAAQQSKGKKRKQPPPPPRDYGEEGDGGEMVHQLPCYDSVDKGSDRTGLCPEIVVHDSPLDVASQCQNGAMQDRTLFFLAPHYPGNFFHLMNDNLVPLVTDLQAFPECNAKDLTCAYPPALAQFWCDKNRKAGGATAWWDALFPAIFGPPLAAETQVLGFNSHKNGKVTTRRTSSSSSSSSSTSSSKLYCVKRASWGLGPRPFYTDFVEQRIAALSAVRGVALRYHGIIPNVMAEEKAMTPPSRLRAGAASIIDNDRSLRSQPRVAGDKLPDVVFVKRYKKKKEDNPRGGGLHYNRVLGDPEQLTRAFQREGVDLRECCDFERDFATQPSSSSPAETSSRTGAMLEMVRHADVIVSLHGAGLVNGVFARDGVMLVELHGGYGADDVIFRRLAQGRQGGYMKARVDEKLEQHEVGEERATAIAACVVALFNGRECKRPLNSDIEEAYRAEDMI